MTGRARHRRPLRRRDGGKLRSEPAAEPPRRPLPLTPAVARGCLDELAAVLQDRNWTTLPLFDHSQPMLRVIDARMPRIGESVVLTAAPKVPSAWQVPWFTSSMGVLFAPCTAPVQAADAIQLLLAPWIAIALRERSDRR